MGYGTNEDFQAYIASMGLVLPVGANLDALRTVGSAYVDGAYEHRLSCSRRTGGFAQDLAWPRTGHYLNGQELPHDFIPPAWVNAAYRSAYLEATSPGWATGSSDPNRKTRMEKVDVIQREYFAATDLVGTADVAAGMPADGVINGMVSVWLCSKGRSLDSLFRVI
jgi:hypothetical protein